MKQIYHRAKRLDNGELVEGFPFCVIVGKKNKYFMLPTKVSVCKPIKDVQIEIDITTLERLKSVKNGIKEFEKL